MKQLPLEFTECPYCESEETIGRIGAAEAGVDNPESVSLRQQVAVMQTSKLGLTVPAMVIAYDICADCGREYVVKVEMKKLPITGVKSPGFPGPGFPGMPGYSG